MSATLRAECSGIKVTGAWTEPSRSAYSQLPGITDVACMKRVERWLPHFTDSLFPARISSIGDDAYHS